jgi:hypothetical protein
MQWALPKVYVTSKILHRVITKTTTTKITYNKKCFQVIAALGIPVDLSGHNEVLNVTAHF